MRILVTGGAGFIGSHVVDRIIHAGHTPVVLDNLSYGTLDNLPSGVELIRGDIRDRELVQRTLKGFDAVAHLAAQRSVVGSMKDPHFDAEVNVLGTINLLDAAESTGVKSFVFASTGGALYGETDGRPTPEDHPTFPESPYGVSKLAAENYVNHYSRRSSMKAITLRMANVYGPRQGAGGEGGVVAIFSERALAGQSVAIFGDGEQTRDYVYVADVAEAFLLGLTATESCTVNIGTAIETSVNGLVSGIEAVTGKTVQRDYHPARPGEIRHSSLEITRARSALSWSPAHSFEAGLAKTVESFSMVQTD